MRHIKLLILILMLLPLGSLAYDQTDAQDNADVCIDTVQVALDAAEMLCDEINRHEACYGNALVEAELQQNVNALQFNAPGDLVNIAALRSLRLSALNLEEDQWGVVEMNLQANIPSSLPENITLVIFGDASLDSGTSTASQTADISVNDTTVSVYAQPWMLAEIIDEITAGQSAIAQGRSEDGAWLQVSLPQGDFGWIETERVEGNEAFDGLEIVESQESFQSPMQAFYFKNGFNEACTAFPTDGLLIQTPEGIGQVSLLINEVDIQLGSTAFIQAQPNGMMLFVLLEGHSRVSAHGMTYSLIPGTMTQIPMNANTRASGPPTEPVPYHMLGFEHLPLRLLPRHFSMPIPPSPDDAQAASNPTDNSNNDGGDTAANSGDPNNGNGNSNTSGDSTGSSSSGGSSGSGGSGGGSTATTPPPSATTPPPPTNPPPTNPPPTDPPPPTDTPTPDSVTICHNGNTITVDWNGWINGHINHSGDTLGACP